MIKTLTQEELKELIVLYYEEQGDKVEKVSITFDIEDMDLEPKISINNIEITIEDWVTLILF